MLGAGIATLTRRWWPVVRHAPARARPAGGAPALGDGAGLVIVANRSAGTPGPLETLGQIVAPVVGVGGDEDEEDPVAEVHAEIHAVLPKAQVVIPTPGEDFVVEVEAALDRPMVDGSATRAIGVAGGDGSVAALAGLAQRRHVPLVVLPEGTLNHFARDVGIDDSPSALAAARDGDAVLVDVGLVDITPAEGEERTVAFVNTASLGGYPDMVKLREDWEEQWGKWPSAAMALVRVLAEATPLVVEIDGRRQSLWLLFVGNGGYQPRGMAPLSRPRLDARVLDVRYLRRRRAVLPHPVHDLGPRRHPRPQPRLRGEHEDAAVGAGRGSAGRAGHRRRGAARQRALRLPDRAQAGAGVPVAGGDPATVGALRPAGRRRRRRRPRRPRRCPRRGSPRGRALVAGQQGREGGAGHPAERAAGTAGAVEDGDLERVDAEGLGGRGAEELDEVPFWDCSASRAMRSASRISRSGSYDERSAALMGSVVPPMTTKRGSSEIDPS